MRHPAASCLLLICLAPWLSACDRTDGESAQVEVDEADIIANNRGVGLMGRYDYEAARQLFEQLDSRYSTIPAFRFNHAVALMNRQLEGD